jgi:hypothetical protein
MTEVEEVHTLFRGSAETAKRFRIIGGACELLAAVVALRGIADDSVVASWQPLAAFLLLAAAVFFRMRADVAGAFAERCRRTSVRAFAENRQVPAGLCTTLRSDAPWCARRAAKRLPATTLRDYYEPSQPSGEQLLRELYAHSSFYTWRLTVTAAWVLGSLTIVVALATVATLYTVATSDAALLTRSAAVDVLFSVVLGAIALRLFEVTVSTFKASSAARETANSLVDVPLAAGEGLHALVNEYDIERASAPAPSTMLYRINRRSLERDWNDRRKALNGG